LFNGAAWVRRVDGETTIPQRLARDRHLAAHANQGMSERRSKWRLTNVDIRTLMFARGSPA
jgi:hypothetical protein